ncbi:MAG TPA: AsmA family protein [Methylophilaceae bacterium]|nr:AsmA family protein [Methylophilaceae bacterium]
MRKTGRLAIAALLILLLLFVLPFFIPTKSYIPKLEQMVAEKLGVVMHIDALHIAILPSPRLNLDKVMLGDHNEVFVEKISVVPALTSLFSDTKVISKLNIKGPVVKKAALDMLAGLIDKQATAPANLTVEVREIVVNDAELIWGDEASKADQDANKHDDVKMPLLNAKISLAAGNRPEAAEIETVDGKLKISLGPDTKLANDKQAGVKLDRLRLVTVRADKWVVPVGYPFLIDALAMEMTLYDNKLDVTNIDAALYHGKVTGTAMVNWANAWSLQGKLKVADLSVREPVSLVRKSTQLSGRMFGNGSFNATAKEPAKLLDHLRASFRFNIQDGVLYGFDLARAASLLLRQGQKGGETQFDKLAGLLSVSGKQYQVSELDVSSGLIAADGAVKMNAKKELDGVVNVELKNSVSLTAIPMQVSGTLDHPVVFPTKTALAGAAAGTALLGPGVGTSIGVKAGSAVDKIKGFFSGDKQ